ncbi:MAG TPA: zinc ABC transporter substrate-binding protein [Pseudonocardiaceae bacterium]|nr:zinc ABC transporter substrate-binding protein [Pseudonocardiaceae bacterium]
MTARPLALLVLATAGSLVAALAAGCSTPPVTQSPNSNPARTIQIIAAENFWGDIAAQLGGAHVRVSSIVSNPATDPHDYEPTVFDGRLVASANLVIVNGIGYDTWADKLLAANQSPERVELNLGQVLHASATGNPHVWYSASDVRTVVDAMVTEFQQLDRADAGYFARHRTTFLNQSLAQYDSLVKNIKAKYAGTPIGASESMVEPLAQDLGLTVLTPRSFLDAISQGSDPTAADNKTIDQQIATKRIKVYVYNSQNATPDVQAQVAAAKAAGIPVATVTETLTPQTATFQQWQVAQLKRIQQALREGTGR